MIVTVVNNTSDKNAVQCWPGSWDASVFRENPEYLYLVGWVDGGLTGQIVDLFSFVYEDKFRTLIKILITKDGRPHMVWVWPNEIRRLEQGHEDQV